MIEAQKKNCRDLRAPRAEARNTKKSRLETLSQAKDLILDGLTVADACDSLGLPRSSYYAAIKPKEMRVSVRGRSARALGDTERARVIETLHSPRFVDKAPPTISATLLDEGTYLCSVRTMYRILEELDEVRERRAIARQPAYKKPELLANVLHLLSVSQYSF